MSKPVSSRKGLGWKLEVPLQSLEALAQEAVHHYHPFKLHRGGKYRVIDNPDIFLKHVQRRIQRTLLDPLASPEHLHGSIRGRSPLTNALSHLGAKLIVRVDLKSFFPSVTDRHVYTVWAQMLGHAPSVAGLLTSLTTFRKRLPQGAPTSTSLANLVLADADQQIKAAARKFGCFFTRYIDDLVFSGADSRRLIPFSIFILQAAGFRISRSKLTIMPASLLQEVTGYGVNSRRGPSIPRYKRDRVRAEIHHLKDIPAGRDFDRRCNSIKGRIRYFSRTNPASAQALQRRLGSVINHLDQPAS